MSARPRSPRSWRAALGTELIRLQCYEGLDISHAVYEWNYPRQILEIRMLEAAHAMDRDKAARELFTEAFLIKRPLLRALEASAAGPPVLLIDEIDRADDEFEGYLLELLSDFQVTIPELGTIRAAEPPIVDHHLEPDARGPRCAEAALPLLPGSPTPTSRRRGGSSPRRCQERRLGWRSR